MNDNMTGPTADHASLTGRFASAINAECAENETDTPDFILAKLLDDVLIAFNDALKRRSEWYRETHRRLIGEAIGAASVCWDHPERAGVFHSSRARRIADALFYALDSPNGTINVPIIAEDLAPAEPVYDLTFSEAVDAMRDGKTVERANDGGVFRRFRMTDGFLCGLTMDRYWQMYSIHVQDLNARYRVVPEEDNG